MLGENALKGKLFFFVVVFLFFSLLYCVQVSSAEFFWKDDFNYASVQDMQNAGWVLDNPAGTSLQADGVVIDGKDADTVIRYRDFPEGLNDWNVETRSMWVGGKHSCPGLDVITEKHVYSFSGNGWYNDLNFDRDGVTETIGSYIDQTGWVTMTMTKIGNTMNLYLNGELMKTYVEADSSPSALIEVDRISPWKGAMLYDYYQVNAAAVASSGDFPILYVAVGGGIAGSVAVGAAAYWYFFAGKTPPASSPSPPRRRFSLSSRGEKSPKGVKPRVNMGRVNTGWGDSVQVTKTKESPSTWIKPTDPSLFEMPKSSDSTATGTNSKKGTGTSSESSGTEQNSE